MSVMRSPGGNGSVTPCQPSSSSVESRGYRERSPDRDLQPVTRSSVLARRFVRLRACNRHLNTVTRRKREMIPADKKDATYWDKRRKNNEAAKRSREKRKFNDLLLEGQLMALSDENAQLRAQVLNLHFHASLTTEKSKVASPSLATPASVLASTLSLSSIPSHTPAFFQAGLWGTRGSSSAAVVNMRQQETTMHPKTPCLSSTRGVFNPLAHHSCITQQGTVPLSGTCVHTHRGELGGRRSPDADVDSQRQVSSSDDIPIRPDGPSKPLFHPPTFLPILDTIRHVPTVSYPAHNWVVPHLNHSAVYNNLLPWRSSYLDTPAVYPGIPLHIQGRQDQGVGVEEFIQRGFKSRFSSAP